MGLGGVAIVILPSIMCLKLTFSDGLGGSCLSCTNKAEVEANCRRLRHSCRSHCE